MGGFGSLGDRVARATTSARIGADTDIFDIQAFRGGLERIIAEGTMEAGALNDIRVFLDAWNRQSRGKDS
jgi:hypothetical protein